MDLFPAIDLRGGKVVRLLQGDYDRQTTYSDDPVTVAQSFAEQGAAWVHVVDLEGARDGRLTHRETIEAICRGTTLNVQVGGGVRTRETIQELLGAGVRRVVLGTAALQDWPWFEQVMSEPIYHQKIVLGLDARDGKLAVRGWEKQLQTWALDVAARASIWPLAAIVYTDIATDGMMTGPNIEALNRMTVATAVPIIASGGVGTLDHLRALSRLPLAGVIVGKAIYERAFTVQEAVEVLKAKV